MLARLEAIDGVREARVDWTGQSFMLTLDSSADADRVVTAMDPILGAATQRLPAAEEREQIASRAAGAPWLRSGETARMSAHEARVLATRYVEEAARDVALDEVRMRRLTALVQDELEKLFRAFESTGLPSRDAMTTEWSGLVDRVGKRSEEFLSDVELGRVTAYLRACCTR